MVIIGKWNHNSVTLSMKPNCTTFSINQQKRTDVYSFDLKGRLWTAMIDKISYRRGLDGKFVAKWLDKNNLAQRQWIVGEEAATITQNARKFVADFYVAFLSQEVELDSSLSPDDTKTIENIIHFTDQDYQMDIRRYQQIYKPVGILPPDQYFSVVLQAAEGCSFNKCNFCNFYRDRKFHIKTPDEFRKHCEDIRDFFGEGLSLRRTIFLGDANALVIPMPKLIALCEIVHEIYDVDQLGGIYAFLDGFSGDKKSVADYKKLASLGLTRIYIGLESGYDPLLKFLNKPGNAASAVEAVKSMKAGGVSVGIIILLGAGGHQFEEAHIKDTIRVLNEMHLGADDLIYFSELIEHENSDYSKNAYDHQLLPLNQNERILQGNKIESGLKFTLQTGTPHISRYDIREFIY